MPSKVDKPYAGGKWSLARARSFVMSALRRAQWPAKYKALADAHTCTKTNRLTGRKAKHFACAKCSGEFVAKDVAVDHIKPVVPVEGFNCGTYLPFGYDWNIVVANLCCEPEGLQVLCKPCHLSKSNAEKELRKSFRQKN
jgi:hypothetical protein